MIQLGQIELDVNDVLGESIAILGVRRSGKSNTAAVLIEDSINDVPYTIIDPEGEYWGLKERYPILIAGAGQKVELPVSVDQAAILAKVVYRNRLSVILDLSDFSKTERHDFLAAYLRALWSLASELRQSHFLVIEEARQFIPQSGSSELKDLLTDYATLGGKRGLVLVVINQRSTNISKDVLTQASILLLHRVPHAVDIAIYKDLIPGKSGKEVEEMVSALKKGQCIYVNGDQVEVISVRLRHTTHGGSTPGLEQPPLRTIDASLLDELRKMMGSKPAPVGVPTKGTSSAPAEDLAPLVKAMSEQIKALEGRIKTLEAIRTVQPVKAPAARRVSQRQPELVLVTASAQQPAFTVGEVEFVEGKDEPGEDLSPEAVQRRNASTQRARAREQTSLNKLSDKVENLARHNKVLLDYLLDQPAKEWLNNRYIARVNGYSETFYVSKIPYDLIDMGIVERNGPDYRINPEFWNRFPNLGREHVIVQMHKRCE